MSVADLYALTVQHVNAGSLFPKLKFMKGDDLLNHRKPVQKGGRVTLGLSVDRYPPLMADIYIPSLAIAIVTTFALFCPSYFRLIDSITIYKVMYTLAEMPAREVPTLFVQEALAERYGFSLDGEPL